MKPYPASAVWSVSAEDYPEDGGSAEKLQFLLRYAILAPSTHNSQPWHFHISGNGLDLCADWSRRLPVVDPEHRELIMSCGAALMHLRLGIRYFGRADEVELLPDPRRPGVLARVRIGDPRECAADDRPLFEAIPIRHTHRLPMDDRPLPDGLFDALRHEANFGNAWLEEIVDPSDREQLADLVAEADRFQWADKMFRRELAGWMHPNRGDQHDGLPGYSLGAGDLMSHIGPLVVRTFDHGAGRAAKDREIAIGSPALAVMGTAGDDPETWLNAGQGLARLLLRARANEVWASFLNQPVEVPSIRSRVAELVGRTDAPQIVLRLGFDSESSTAPHPTPRRSVKEVLSFHRHGNRLRLDSHD